MQECETMAHFVSKGCYGISSLPFGNFVACNLQVVLLSVLNAQPHTNNIGYALARSNACAKALKHRHDLTWPSNWQPGASSSPRNKKDRPIIILTRLPWHFQSRWRLVESEIWLESQSRTRIENFHFILSSLTCSLTRRRVLLKPWASTHHNMVASQ